MKMRKQRRRCAGFAFAAILILFVFLSAACGRYAKYSRYEADFTELFDTHTIVTGYAKSEAEFESYVKVIYDKLTELHRYYDIYHEYEDIANIKTINDHAGKAPVEVGEELLGLLRFAKEAYTLSDGTVNVAMGSVLRIWHTYREEGLLNPSAAVLPTVDTLMLCDTDMDALIIDEESQTAFIKTPGVSLDVGAIAKGYAAKLAAEEARAAGVTSATLNMGGNVVCIGKPLDNKREKWGVGIRNPDADAEDFLLDAVYVNDAAVVTSGSYQRYYIVNGKRYSHIIDPQTMMPAERYESITIIHEDSAVADVLSTALFVMPYDEGMALAERSGAEALWVFPDQSRKETDGYAEMARR